MHSMELFDEAQNMKWIGVVSVGILLHWDDSSSMVQTKEEGLIMLEEGPACNATNKLVGWHTFCIIQEGVWFILMIRHLPTKLE
ncbi:hypothetical protein VIGAN_03220200 [Vigna angularis var. angularis]|uniref:Glycosyltransferases n=1 Tax=Vigna angularis var. angularis TaxID=157739 RepID=A0A0S3RNQ3_PHAAN|nr:hypothetical protein VIGAN_03220200 [Vigna angularis var. angularis]